MTVLLFSVVLFLLGLLGAQSLVATKVPALKSFIDKLTKYQEPLGIIGLVLGVIYFIMMLDMIRYIGLVSGHFLLALVSVATMIGLGLIFGLEILRRNLKDTSSTAFVKLENLRLTALRNQKQLGVAGVVLGLLSFFAYI